jgi:hypothetical protein
MRILGVPNMDIKSVALFLAFISMGFVGCHKSTPMWPQSTFTDRSYVDLQPGWRIRVVVPVLQSGGYKVGTEEVHNNDGTVSLRTERGFLGYETDYYQVNQRGDGKPVIRFQSAEFTSTERKKIRKPKPLIALFVFPEGIEYVRLLFLTRVSENEHDAAVLAASSLAALDGLIPRVEANPLGNCTAQPDGLCAWIPEGIAVQPEKRDPQNNKAWIPAL